MRTHNSVGIFNILPENIRQLRTRHVSITRYAMDLSVQKAEMSDRSLCNRRKNREKPNHFDNVPHFVLPVNHHGTDIRKRRHNCECNVALLITKQSTIRKKSIRCAMLLK